MKNVPNLILPLLLFVTAGALADDAAVLTCRTLPEAASRLACYDAMPVGQARAAAAASIPAADVGQQSVKAPPFAAIESTIAGDFDGWGPNTRFRLANGQVWRVVDDSSAALPRVANQKVRIERNLIGTLFLSVEGSNHAAKVRRVQ